MMKNYQYIYALILFLLNGCSAEQVYQEKDKRAFVLMQTTVAGGMTRAAGERETGICFDGGTMQPYLMDSQGTTLSPDGEVEKIYFQTAQQVIKVKGWSPRNIGDSFSVQADQSNGLNSSDYLYAPETEYTLANYQTTSLAFHHQTAKVCVTLLADEGISLSGAQVSIVNTNLSASVQADGSLSTATPVDGTSISMQNDGTKYEALVIPQTMTGKKFIKITTSNGSDNYYYTPQEGEATLQAGKQYNYTITLKQEYIEVTVGKEQVSWENGGSGNGSISQATPTTVTLKDSWGANGIYTVAANSNVVLDGNSTEEVNKRIVIEKGAHVVLKSVKIKCNLAAGDAGWHYGIEVKGTATIALEGENVITGTNMGNYNAPHAALKVSGGTLTITGSDRSSLKLTAGNGIFSCALELENSSLIINGGNITADASASWGAPGIGAGQRGSCNDITIAGGIVTAKGAGAGGQSRRYCPGIGCGAAGSCGNITISGAGTKVTATKGGGTYDIGPNEYSSCGTVTILDGIKITDEKGNPATIYGHTAN